MANASLSSKSPMSSIERPALRSAFSVLGTGPMPMISGSTPANAKDTRVIFGARPSSFTASPLASRAAVAPSLRPDELPAVTRPCGRNGVRSPASPSSVVSGRMASSRVASPQPLSERVATGTRSGWISPFASARAVFCWLASA